MGIFAAYAIGPGSAWLRTLKLIGAMITRPHILLRSYLRMISGKWATHTVIFLVMQTLDNSMKMVWKKNRLFGGMSIKNEGNARVPAYIDIGQKVMTQYAEKVNAFAANSITEVVFNMSTTAHILGGCPMGATAAEGVINDKFQVHGYPNMYILDGSVVQGNLGVNPSLTITALSEYAMSHIPDKEGNTRKKLSQLLAEMP
jgi:cholesterol oxidase